MSHVISGVSSSPLPTVGAVNETRASTRQHEIRWSGGCAILKEKLVEDAVSSCSMAFSEFALGFAFQGQGGDMHWEVDGQRVYDQKARSFTVCRELVVLPAGCQFKGNSRGASECLWLTFDHASVATLFGQASFTREPRVDEAWCEDRLAWLLALNIRQECRSGGTSGPVYTENLAWALASQLLRLLHDRTCRDTGSPPALDARALCRLTEFMDANLSRNITLAELATVVGLTPGYVCRAFKHATGRPPHQYLIERRIERAKAYLREGLLSIGQIALAVGFTSQSHLTDHFRRIVGITPGRFRASSRH